MLARDGRALEAAMTTTLWDTTGTAVVKALAAERRTGGAVTSGLALTLVVVVDEKDVARGRGGRDHRGRRSTRAGMLIVIRRQIEAPVPGWTPRCRSAAGSARARPSCMRMYGRLALHAESVMLPLLAPDAPVVDVVARRAARTASPTTRSACSPTGGSPTCSRADDPVAALRQRADDFAPGDTDLAWTRLTGGGPRWPRRSTAGTKAPTSAVVDGDDADPSALLLAGWLASRLGLLRPGQQDGRRSDRPGAHHPHGRCRY